MTLFLAYAAAAVLLPLAWVALVEFVRRRDDVRELASVYDLERFRRGMR